MTILEIAMKPATQDSVASAHIDVDGKQYLILAGRSWVTVLAGRQWINSRRALGRTFHSMTELVANYRRHGRVIGEYAAKLATLAA